MLRATFIFPLLFLALSACAVRSTHDREWVSARLEEQAGHPLGEASRPGAVLLPAGISLADGLSEGDAVSIALWNNAAFQADLVDLGFARADLLEAGLLENPVLSVLFPLGPKQLEASLSWPLASLWQRSRRLAAAEIDAERVAERLVQNGLDLVAAVRVAFASLALAEDQARVASDAARVQQQIGEISRARFSHGDISETDSRVASSQALRASEEAASLAHEVTIAAGRLRSLLGLDGSGEPLAIRPAPVAAPGAPLDLDGLLATAAAARPDLRAAELAIEAAGERAGWERSRVLALSAILDANAKGADGFEAGPGVAVTLPLFDRNQARTARAEASMEQAARRYVDVKRRVDLEVRESATRLLQAASALSTWRGEILPAAEQAQRSAEGSYAAGEVSYLHTLESTRAFLEARRREVELSADVRRALAGLERSIGSRLR